MNTVLVPMWDYHKLYMAEIIVNIFKNTHILPLKLLDNMNKYEGSWNTGIVKTSQEHDTIYNNT